MYENVLDRLVDLRLCFQVWPKCESMGLEPKQGDQSVERSFGFGAMHRRSAGQAQNSELFGGQDDQSLGFVDCCKFDE